MPYDIDPITGSLIRTGGGGGSGSVDGQDIAPANATLSGNLTFSAANKDVGDGAGNDPRDGHFTRNVTAGGAVRTPLLQNLSGAEPYVSLPGNAVYLSAGYSTNHFILNQSGVTLTGYLASGTKTVGTIPDPGDVPVNAQYLVTDASGGARPFFNDGTNWRDFAGAILS